MHLANKVIMVIGAGLLGQALVKELIQQESKVIIIDNNVETLKSFTAIGSEKVFCMEGDLTSSESMQGIFIQSIAHFGQIDGAVNTSYPRNSHYGRDFLDVTYSDFTDNVGRHLGGYFLFMQHCVRYALENKQKLSLVNLSSVYGLVAPRFDLYEGTNMTMPVEYAAIKAGLQHLVKYVSAYTKGSYFRVNCVSPGGIFAEQNPLFVKRYQKYCQKKGMLDSQDILGTIIFLLSDQSEYIVGQNIVIDDGFSL